MVGLRVAYLRVPVGEVLLLLVGDAEQRLLLHLRAALVAATRLGGRSGLGLGRSLGTPCGGWGGRRHTLEVQDSRGMTGVLQKLCSHTGTRVVGTSSDRKTRICHANVRIWGWFEWKAATRTLRGHVQVVTRWCQEGRVTARRMELSPS